MSTFTQTYTSSVAIYLLNSKLVINLRYNKLIKQPVQILKELNKFSEWTWGISPSRSHCRQSNLLTFIHDRTSVVGRPLFRMYTVRSGEKKSPRLILKVN